MTYKDYISRFLLFAILLVWAVLFVAMALDSGGASITALLRDTYNVPTWLSAFFCFGTAAIFSWSSLSALVSKSWPEERFETVALSMCAALGVSLGFAGLTPQSEFWQFIAQLGVVASLLLTAVAMGLLLAVSTMPVVQKKMLLGSNDNMIYRANRRASSAHEVVAFQTLKDRWQP